MTNKSGLGRGLGALIPEKRKLPKSANRLQSQDQGVLEVTPSSIERNPEQPRSFFDKRELMELAASIKEHGIIQPLIVTKKSDDTYELIAGERRLQAAKLVLLKKVPIVVRTASSQEKLERSLIENIQRTNLNVVEEATAYQRLIDEFSLTQEQVAKKVGKSRVTITNALRLLSLPVEVQRALIDGKITTGHAKAILAMGHPEKMRALFQMIIKQKLSVREAEKLAQKFTGKIGPAKQRRNEEFDELARKAEDKLGTRVNISGSKRGGKISIAFSSFSELQNFIKKLIS